MCEIPVGTKVWKKAVRIDVSYGTWAGRGRDYALIEMEVLEPGFVATYEGDYDLHPSGRHPTNFQNKGRVRAAKVLSIVDRDGNPLSAAISAHCLEQDLPFYYTVGATVTPREPFDERDIACASGIHCFTEKWQAKNYDF